MCVLCPTQQRCFLPAAVSLKPTIVAYMKCALSKNNKGCLHLSHPHYHGCFPAFWPTVTDTVAPSLTFSFSSSGASSGTLPRHGGMSCWESGEDVWGTRGLKDSSSALAPLRFGAPVLYFFPHFSQNRQKYGELAYTLHLYKSKTQHICTCTPKSEVTCYHI